MKIKLTYEEACSVLQKYYYDALVEEVPDDDIEIEIEPEAMEDRIEFAFATRHRGTTLGPTEIPWQPDGETTPPSADAFMAWANGKEVCLPWDHRIPITIDSIDDIWVNFLYANGNKDRCCWLREDWQEYTDAN